MALEKTAMHAQGQWAPGTMQANTADKQAVKWNLGWFPFPSVSGGTGEATDGFGGGNGFAVGKDAPPEAVEFLQVHQREGRRPIAGAPSTPASCR